MKALATFLISTFFIIFAVEASIKDYVLVPPAQWLSKPVKGLDEYWVSPTDKSVALAVLNETSSQKYVAPDHSQDFIKKMIEMRKLSLGLMGIRNYRLNTSTLEKKSNGFEIAISGSYTSFDGHSVFFKEAQYYIGNRYFQLTVTSNEASKNKLAALSESIFKSFQVKE